ncbi:MAG: MFS transporter [Candidatus Omnitrophica bacterium]|nr:MFS transporter [Candidatus Omnitrophota bacterium]
MAHIRRLLKNKNFFFLWFGQIISQLGDRLGQMALIGFVSLNIRGSSIEIAKALFFTILPVFLIGPLAGVYVDRWDRRKTLYMCDFLRAILVMIIPLFLIHTNTKLPVYLLIFLIFSIGRFFIPAKLAIVPDLVERQDLLLANSLINTTGMIAAILGFGLGGVLVEWCGPKGGFYLDSLSFFISALFIFFIRQKKLDYTFKIKEVASEIVNLVKKSVLEEIKEGFVYFFKNKHIRFTAWIMFILWSALGSIYVVLIVFIQETLSSITRDLGFLITSVGCGLFLGSLLYGRFGQKLPPYRSIFLSLILSGLFLAFFSLSLSFHPNFFIALILTFILGIVISPIMITSYTLIHKVSQDYMMGKIFSSLEMVMHFAFILFMFISSFLAHYITTELYILLGVSIVFVILGFMNLIYHRKILWLR